MNMETGERTVPCCRVPGFVHSFHVKALPECRYPSQTASGTASSISGVGSMGPALVFRAPSKGCVIDAVVFIRLALPQANMERTALKEGHICSHVSLGQGGGALNLNPKRLNALDPLW